jgi:hypothetical protein
MIKISKSLIHWNYFLALERDLETTSRYIEFIEANFKTYSIELAHLLLASSSEIDVVIKSLCALIAPGEKRENIDDYRNIIKSHLPEFIDESIFINRYGISLKPWDNWLGEVNPNWWRSYNKVKHERDIYFDQANLENVIRSMGALLITNYHFYKKQFENEQGVTFEPKVVIDKLQLKSEFIKLNSSYYYDVVVV